ncbi:MAG: 30S ribosomal protein S4 [Candidatus Krumholzibacteria bacterium]|jgi:small subunit ribosomal protein S4|nr:30S ribosomal protein S4 [Candidatus Krumholzibacteria bacterium]
MARYTGPACKLCRREGTKLFLKGDRCHSDRCAIEKRNYPPGEHGQARSNRRSNYRVQLREKQKLRRMYMILEKQFRNYFIRAAQMKGITGENLLRLLEGRLDNMVFRMGFAPSRATARQLILHNHFEVNGRRVNIPSYQVLPGDRVSPREKSSSLLVIEESLKGYGSRGTVPYISVDVAKKEGTYTELPTRDVIPVPIEENLIVELYSK